MGCTDVPWSDRERSLKHKACNAFHRVGSPEPSLRTKGRASEEHCEVSITLWAIEDC